jgi:RNA polymerase sigma-70 factor (ECF subfamily)
VARSCGLDDAAAEDTVQETLISAWIHAEQLRSPERLHPWLDQICRNAARATMRRDAARGRHELRTTGARPDAQAGDASSAIERIAEEFNVTETLEQADTELLIDRLLGALPPQTRELIELCYLAELTQAEIALRTGLSLSAVEARLHRARRELRRLLNGEYRAEAEDFGLHLDPEQPTGWRQTREWCRLCGATRLLGRFEEMADGRVNLRLRCTKCRFRINSGGAIELSGRVSFRPAVRRFFDAACGYLQASGSADATRRPCPYCSRPRAMRLVTPDDETARRYHWDALTVFIECVACDVIVDCYPSLVAWSHPEVRTFVKNHPRWVGEPETITTLSGRSVIQMPIRDRIGSARLVLYAHMNTLEILGTSRN